MVIQNPQLGLNYEDTFISLLFEDNTRFEIPALMTVKIISEHGNTLAEIFAHNIQFLRYSGYCKLRCYEVFKTIIHAGNAEVFLDDQLSTAENITPEKIYEHDGYVAYVDVFFNPEKFLGISSPQMELVFRR